MKVYKQQKAVGERNANIESLRIISMLMIITLHYYNQGGILDNITLSFGIHYYVAWLIEALCFVSVNLYVLISGYFLVKGKFSLKKIIVILAEMWFYSMGIYLIFCLVGIETFNWKSVITAYLFPVIKGQWWFGSVYVVLYLLHPVLNRAILAFSKKEYQFCIGLLFILFCVIPKIFFFSADQIGIKNGYSLLWFLMLYIVAAYFRIYEEAMTNIKCIPIFFIMIFMTAMIKFLQVCLGIEEYINFYSYNSPTVYLASVCMFIGFVRRKSEKIYFQRYICAIAKTTFGIFLIHTHPMM